MSGPKVSKYSLSNRRREEEEAEYRRRLKEERKREAERREKERKEHEECLGYIRGYEKDAKSLNEQVEGLYKYYENLKKSNNDSEGCAELKKIKSEISELLNQSTNTLENSQRALASYKKQIPLIKMTLERLNDGKNNKQNQMVDQIGDELLSRIEIKAPVYEERDLDNRSQEDASNQNQEKEKKQEEKLEAKECLDRTTARLQDAVPEIVEELERIICVAENLYRSTDYHGVISYLKTKEDEIEKKQTQIIKQQEQFSLIEKQLKDKFDNELFNYLYICDLLQTEPEDYQGVAISEGVIENIIAKRELLEEEYMKRRERQIVKEEIEAVMEELGYNVIADKETNRKNGDRIVENVYEYNEGTAINIIEVNGQITMEVVGIDNKDRDPSAEESEYLEEEMVSFCSLHKDIEAKLRERGVVLNNRIQMNPPSKVYAQILNIDEYDKKKEPKSIKVKKQVNVTPKKSEKISTPSVG